MDQNKLAISIPTYNRAGILSENLLQILEIVELLRIAIYIFDDSTNDHTDTMVKELLKKADVDIFYHKNSPRLGHDKNVIKALTEPTASFVWLLGDSIRIDKTCLHAIYKQLEGYDLLFVNGRCDGITSMFSEYVPSSDVKMFMGSRTWEFTLTGATIFSEDVIKWWINNPQREVFKNFPQLSMLLGFIAENSAPVLGWFGCKALCASTKKESYWSSNVVEVFGRDWVAVILGNKQAFDNIQLSNILLSHSKNTGVLSYSNLIKLRSLGLFSPNVMNENKEYLALSSATNLCFRKLIAAMPIELARLLVAIKEILLNITNKT